MTTDWTPGRGLDDQGIASIAARQAEAVMELLESDGGAIRSQIKDRLRMILRDSVSPAEDRAIAAERAATQQAAYGTSSDPHEPEIDEVYTVHVYEPVADDDERD